MEKTFINMGFNVYGRYTPRFERMDPKLAVEQEGFFRYIFQYRAEKRIIESLPLVKTLYMGRDPFRLQIALKDASFDLATAHITYEAELVNVATLFLNEFTKESPFGTVVHMDKLSGLHALFLQQMDKIGWSDFEIIPRFNVFGK